MLFSFRTIHWSTYTIPFLQNTSKFWILQKYRHRDCHGDKCWKELLFPFTHNKDGDNVHYAAMYGMVLLPIVIGYLCFTHEIW